MSCLTSYCYCENFGNTRAGEISENFGTRFAVSAVKAANNAAISLIINQSGTHTHTERERERERERE
ncbi:MAG: hypothetical protein LBF59_06210, partial [Prevotellaceae bacterium]|nr:hypothetical protein [Prevotellaceae bacterium]